MGWLVKRKTLKNGVEKYRLYTTVSDGYLTKWSTREEIVRFIFWDKLYKCMEDTLKTSMTFPNGYRDKDTDKQILGYDTEDYYSFMSKAFKDDNYMETVGNKFLEILKTSGVSLSVSDTDGFSMSTKD